MKFAIITISALFFVLVSFILIISKNHKHVITSVNKVSAPISLNNYLGTNSSVVFTTYGNLVSDASRTAVRISVSSANVNISVLNGYQEKVVKTEDIANNSDAYKAFLTNLDTNGFLASKSTNLQFSSACPNGETYSLVLNVSGAPLSNLWDDNCNPGIDGTFKGNGKQNIFDVSTLFQNQISNYSDFTADYVF